MPNDKDTPLAWRITACLAMMFVNLLLILFPKGSSEYLPILIGLIVGDIAIAWAVLRGIEPYESSNKYAQLARISKYVAIILIGAGAAVILVLAIRDVLTNYSPVFFLLGSGFALVVLKVLDTSLEKKILQASGNEDGGGN